MERSKKIASMVESLSQTEIEELFRIIHRYRFNYTRNNHGVFINLSWVPPALLVQLEEYVEFCQRSKHELRKYESLCDALNKQCTSAMATKGNATGACGKEQSAHAEGDASPCKEEGAAQAEKVPVNRVSSSMRFYLLKKKYSKIGSVGNNLEIDLSPEPYVLQH